MRIPLRRFCGTACVDMADVTAFSVRSNQRSWEERERARAPRTRGQRERDRRRCLRARRRALTRGAPND